MSAEAKRGWVFGGVRRRAAACVALLLSLTALSASSGGCSGEGGDSTGGQGTAGAPAAAGGAAAGDAVTYCDVEPILATYCVRCHAEPPSHGAPFPLESYADTQADRGTRQVFELMGDMVEARLMPPTEWDVTPPVEALSDEDRALLLDWTGDGAPPGSCD